MITSHIYCRIGGHITIALSLSIPLLYNLVKIELARSRNPEIDRFATLRFRYATVWNAVFILIYALFGTYADLKSLQKRESDIPEKYKNYRHTLFAGIIFPLSTSMLLFWPLFYYDRELIYRSVYDDVINIEINYIVHGLVFIYCVWEIVFSPRNLPKKNEASWWHLHLFNLFYLFVVLFTKYDLDEWLYDILIATEGTLAFYPWLFSVWAASALGYSFQWKLKTAVWHYRDHIHPYWNMGTNKYHFHCE